ncbi:NAD(P)-binding protein [Penicillium sp. IBT 16267x]|nr:NAD(P)-binding protein [Penicillium sp. IBT 16267x]
MGVQFSQVFPPSPTFTAEDLPDQSGKVILITGGTSGIGFELAKILYAKGAKVYIAGRSEENAQAHIQAIQSAVPNTGTLTFLPLHLDDLATIKKTVDVFQSKESKLDLLFNNAGVSQPPVGSLSKQGSELQLATNCLGPFLLTRLLMPSLKAAAATASAGSVRVVWTSSQVVEFSAPPEGMIMTNLDDPPKDPVANYTASKIGNWFLAAEMARREGESGIISVAQNPGAANTKLLRNARLMKFFSWPLLHSPAQAAHTLLYAGFSPDLNLENHATSYVIPWGRLHPGVAENLERAVKPAADGGTGRAAEFWEYCTEKTKDYA